MNKLNIDNFLKVKKAFYTLYSTKRLDITSD